MRESGDGDHVQILDGNVMDIDRDFPEVSPHGGILVLVHFFLTPYLSDCAPEKQEPSRKQESTTIACVISKCAFCRKYVTVSNLSRHIRETHPNRLPRTKKNKNLKKADFILNSKVHKCSSPCTATFARIDNLKAHQQSIKCCLQRPYKCQYCDSCFNSERALFNHKYNKSCLKQFKCHNCHSYFSTITALYDHSIGCVMEIE